MELFRKEIANGKKSYHLLGYSHIELIICMIKYIIIQIRYITNHAENYWQMTHSNYAYTEVTVLRDLLKTNFEITILFLYLFVCMHGHTCAISSLLPVRGSGVTELRSPAVVASALIR